MVFHSNASTCVSVCASGVIIQTKQRGKSQNERQQRLLREGGVSCQVWLPQFAQSSFSNSDQELLEEPGTRVIYYIHGGMVGEDQPSQYSNL